MKNQDQYQKSVAGTTDIQEGSHSWFKDFSEIVKLRLNLLVVFSTVLAALIAAVGMDVSWLKFLYIGLGGFFITGSSLTFNQILEQNYDARMHRTENRPLPAGRMTRNQAVLLAGAFFLVGVVLLSLVNAFTVILSVLSLIVYSFVYTPLKRITPFAVHVGALPGAMPALIGVVAITGGINTLAVILFTIQFFWQFSHFWSIAWVSHDDYTNAGFKLLPSKGNVKSKEVGMHSVLYTLVLIPGSLLLLLLPEFNVIAVILVTILSGLYLYQAINFYKKLDDKSARTLMFGSFIYLPAVLLVLYIGLFI